eukprot:Skav203482  [mRNA]  locus=scaffold921:365199:371984:+ [translate_table: standard]
MAVLPAWRRTGRKAKEEHYSGLCTGAFIEFVGYTDRRAQQGRLLGCLAECEPLHERERGKAALMHVLAIEDEYFEYWHEQTYGTYAPTVMTPVHFCERPTGACGSATRYRDPLHIDVFRVLAHDEVLQLGWLTDVHKARIEGPPQAVPGAGARGLGGDTGTPAPGAGDAGGSPAGAGGVRPGAAGIMGLAGALGAGGQREAERQAELDALRAKKAERLDGADQGNDGEEDKPPKEKGSKKRPSDDLLKELHGRSPKEPRLSALDLATSSKKDKKKRSKKKKKKKKEKDKDDSGSSSSGSTSTSSEELFRVAALPKGMEKLRRVHQKYPGRIASRSLLRLQELLMNAQPYPCTFLLLDQQVSLFIEELWENGDPQGWASDCLSGLGHFIPACKPHLISSWRLHSAWSRAELPCRAPPFTPLVLYALAHQAVANHWTDLAVLLILGFHTFARAGELFQCKVGDFTFDRSSGTWSLPLSKSGQRAGATESLLLTDPFVLTLLRNFCKAKLPGDRLSSASPGLLRKRLGTLLEQLGLTFPYRWYSVRRGGATHAYRTTNNIAAVCVRGRWNAMKTARIYICDGVAQLSELTLAPAKQQRLRRLAVACRPDFEQCS